jgi:hypothetical protein
MLLTLFTLEDFCVFFFTDTSPDCGAEPDGIALSEGAICPEGDGDDSLALDCGWAHGTPHATKPMKTSLRNKVMKHSQKSSTSDESDPII